MSDEKAIATRDVETAAAPLDMPAEVFRAALDRRKANRSVLMEWVRSALVDGVDFGKIHVVKKEKCDKGKYCDNPRHFSKPSLFKPGAEKICGMLGVTVSYPTLNDYEKAALTGVSLTSIILRCELLNAQGQVIADGVGARSLAQDNGDLNKALKMAAKSCHIDATLRMAGLSEVFTQDLEDMQPEKIGGESATGGAQSRPAQKTPSEEARGDYLICPKCGQYAIIKGSPKYGGGWVCWKKREGCGAKWTDEEWEKVLAMKEPLPDSAEAQAELLDAQNEAIPRDMANRLGNAAGGKQTEAATAVFEPPAGPKNRPAQEKAARAFVRGPSKDDEKEARELF